MTVETLTEDLAEVKEQYGDVKITENSSATLVRIDSVDLPLGCQPKASPVLMLIKPGQPRPEIYVKSGIRVPNGIVPRSTSDVSIEGESWMQFSYQFSWDGDQHSLVQFIEGALRRFSKNE
jgi:hypothetical protein